MHALIYSRYLQCTVQREPHSVYRYSSKKYTVSPDSALRKIWWTVQVWHADINAQPIVLRPAFYIKLQYELDYDRNSSHEH